MLATFRVLNGPMLLVTFMLDSVDCRTLLLWEKILWDSAVLKYYILNQTNTLSPDTTSIAKLSSAHLLTP